MPRTHVRREAALWAGDIQHHPLLAAVLARFNHDDISIIEQVQVLECLVSPPLPILTNP